MSGPKPEQSFENCVNFTGDKTLKTCISRGNRFENCVNFTGDKTLDIKVQKGRVFDNCVNFAGDKTLTSRFKREGCLRTVQILLVIKPCIIQKNDLRV